MLRMRAADHRAFADVVGWREMSPYLRRGGVAPDLVATEQFSTWPLVVKRRVGLAPTGKRRPGMAHADSGHSREYEVATSTQAGSLGYQAERLVQQCQMNHRYLSD
jgi:hypothetical protein